MSGLAMPAVKAVDEGFLARLQPNDRRALLLLIAVFFVVAASLMVYLRTLRVSAAEEEIIGLREGIELLRVRGPAYQEKLAGKNSRESQISDTPVVFGTLIERAEGVAEVSVSGQEEKPPVELNGGLRMKTVEFSLKNVTLEQLTKFIAELESESERVVLTQKLLIRSSSGSEDRLSANVEVATWERRNESAFDTEQPG